MKNIAVISHDSKKPFLAEFIKTHHTWIQGVNIIATGRTAEYLEEKKVHVTHLSQGRYGGYNQITEMITKKQIDLVIFFIDSSIPLPHHADIKRLIDTCVSDDIPFATNGASAELLIIGLIRKEIAKKAKSNL